MKLLPIITIVLVSVVMSGCSSNSVKFDKYQEKIMMCEQMGMRVHVVNGIRNSVPYVREVVCYDRHGASWNTSNM